jgi:hypothetical protein
MLFAVFTARYMLRVATCFDQSAHPQAIQLLQKCKTVTAALACII